MGGRPVSSRAVHERAPRLEDIDPHGAAFYTTALTALADAAIPYMVGGAYAFARYTGLVRHTKDFDIFIERRDCPRALEVLGSLGYRTDHPFPHWLAKAYDGEHYVDLIYGAGNGVAIVDEDWFRFAVDAELFGVPVQLIPVEEMIWSKAFVMERERFDGADVAHLIRARAAALDWDRLIARFADKWRVLYAHLVLFGFIFPTRRDLVPKDVLDALTERLRAERRPDTSSQQLCNGTLLSRAQYRSDVEQGLADARLVPNGGTMTREEIAVWTAAIDEES
jgi:hypothetical protein